MTEENIVSGKDTANKMAEIPTHTVKSIDGVTNTEQVQLSAEEPQKGDPWCSRSLWCPRKHAFDGREQTTSFTAAEIRTHATENDCWIVHKGKVYDVTQYLKQHPGGMDNIVEYAGQDVTKIFALTGHSPHAYNELYKFLIGSVTDPKAMVAAGGDMMTRTAKLVAREQTSHPNVIRLKIVTTDGLMPLAPGEHVFVTANIDGGTNKSKESISRPYTPISVEQDDDGQQTTLTLIVKVYRPAPPGFPNGGRFSQILEDLPINTTLQITGPDSDCVYLGGGNIQLNHEKIPRTGIRHVCMIAGGTGITPIFRIIESIVARDAGKTSWNLVYANKTEEDILMRHELDQLAQQCPDGSATVYNTLSNLAQQSDSETKHEQDSIDSNKSDWAQGRGYINATMLRAQFADALALKDLNGVLFLVCGPPPMMTAVERIVLQDLGVPSNNILLMGAKTQKLPKNDDINGKKCNQKCNNWIWEHPHVIYILSSLVLVLTLLAINRGEYGLGHRFSIRGFAVGGYAYILDDVSSWTFWDSYAHWLCYIPHQIAVIAVTGIAQSQSPTYSERFRWFNWTLFGINAFFICLKWTQTHLTYNGLSAQLPLWFGVATVALMLMMVQAMYIPTRGIICGCARGRPLCCCDAGCCKNTVGTDPHKVFDGDTINSKQPNEGDNLDVHVVKTTNGDSKSSASPHKQSLQRVSASRPAKKKIVCSFWHEAGLYLRKYHAYYISFALVNDFWYHPFEASPGHLLGVLNDVFLLWQMTAIYTHGHRNKYWCLLLECMVLPHSALIALDRGTGASGMFGFAYLLLLVVTQQFQVTMHAAFRILLIIVFFVSVGLTYGMQLQYDCTSCEPIGLDKMYMIFFIPMMNYIVACVYLPSAYWLFRHCFTNVKGTKLRIGLCVVASTISMAILFPLFSLFLSTDRNATEHFIEMSSSLNLTQCPIQRCNGYPDFARDANSPNSNAFDMFQFNTTNG